MTTRAVDYAQSALKYYWDKTVPVRPDDIISKIDDVELVYEDLPDNISGKVSYDFNRQRYVITVNKTHHKNRQRFTIAHELGHYALGHGAKEDVIYRNGSQDPDEIEANAFAAEILMPKGVIHHLIFNEGINTVQELAHKFWVSEQAMIYRLKNLGLVS